ncbi:MAG: DUF47 family protein [Bacillota bacterium]|nr:MAG: DUF47 domain-containing protein [Bacillota bacterium]
MVFSWLQRDRQFFALLTDAAQNLLESSQTFAQLVENLSEAPALAARLKELERRGDRYTHEVITLLNKRFVTPIDREEILALALEIDDVVDGLEAAASRLDIYRIAEADRHIREFTGVIQRQAEEIAAAIHRLERDDLLRMRENAVQINILENQADEILRQALADLFQTVDDPKTIIKLKEIYETLELVTDKAEDVANALESVVMKHA